MKPVLSMIMIVFAVIFALVLGLAGLFLSVCGGGLLLFGAPVGSGGGLALTALLGGLVCLAGSIGIVRWQIKRGRGRDQQDGAGE